MKDFFKFIFSKTFVKQLIYLGIFAVVGLFLLQIVLKSYTNHNEYITVPDLSKYNIERVKRTLAEENLAFIVKDSANFNAKYPPFSVITQQPNAGEKVKEGRKIYLTLNPHGYAKVKVPNIIDKTKRQAIPSLKNAGFTIGKTYYIDNIAKDVVLEIRHNDSKIKPGIFLTKTSKIDLVLGNGNGN
jgi:beta-lactam-binding protein with PASTA domain